MGAFPVKQHLYKIADYFAQLPAETVCLTMGSNSGREGLWDGTEATCCSQFQLYKGSQSSFSTGNLNCLHGGEYVPFPVITNKHGSLCQRLGNSPFLHPVSLSCLRNLTDNIFQCPEIRIWTYFTLTLGQQNVFILSPNLNTNIWANTLFQHYSHIFSIWTKLINKVRPRTRVMSWVTQHPPHVWSAGASPGGEGASPADPELQNL